MPFDLKKTTPFDRELIPEACDPTKNRVTPYEADVEAGFPLSNQTWLTESTVILLSRAKFNSDHYVLDHAIFDQDRELNLKRQKIPALKAVLMSLNLTDFSLKGYVTGEIYTPYISLELFYLQIVSA